MFRLIFKKFELLNSSRYEWNIRKCNDGHNTDLIPKRSKFQRFIFIQLWIFILPYLTISTIYTLSNAEIQHLRQFVEICLPFIFRILLFTTATVPEPFSCVVDMLTTDWKFTRTSQICHIRKFLNILAVVHVFMFNAG